MPNFDPSNQVHPTAILEGNIQLGKDNNIGPHVVLRGNITIGDNNTIETGVVFEYNVTIGNNNYFYPYAVIGALGEMGLKGDFFNEEGQVRIGNDVTIREFVCVHSPVYRQETIIDDHAYLMNKSYVAHDCHIGKNVVLSAGVLLAGRCVVDDDANIGLGTTVHQRLHIGKFAMIGMQSVITRNILPYAKVSGNPARIMGFNQKGAERSPHEDKWQDEMNSFFASDISLEANSSNPIKQEVYDFLMQYPESLTKAKR